MQHLLTRCCLRIEAIFYPIVAVPRSADPFTLKAAECSVSALQSSQYCWLLGQHICSTDALQSVFFAVKPEGSRTSISCELHEPAGYKETYFHCGVTLTSNWPYMNQWKASTAQRCVQVAILPSILGCYFSSLDHRPIRNTLLCLTAFPIKSYYYTFLEKIPLHKTWFNKLSPCSALS